MYEIIGINGYREDYNQSSNALFHFMKEQRFLNAALMSRALYPRYCLEDISYLVRCHRIAHSLYKGQLYH